MGGLMWQTTRWGSCANGCQMGTKRMPNRTICTLLLSCCAMRQGPRDGTAAGDARCLSIRSPENGVKLATVLSVRRRAEAGRLSKLEAELLRADASFFSRHPEVLFELRR
jgi:hypothetical protein